MINNIAILGPLLALIVWSMVMWVWMYATRLPAISATKLKLDPTVPPSRLMEALPAKVRWKADNYNHLMEQPTLFYALVLTIALMGQGDGWNLYFAWAYVGLRVVHSLVQALTNIIEVRFTVYVLSNIPLIALLISAIRSFCVLSGQG